MTDTVYKTLQTPGGGRFFRAWTDGVVWERGAQEQVHRLLALPFVEEVAVMADSHLGKGGPVGVAVKFGGAIIPSVVGVDIGCGMYAVLTDVPASALDSETCQALYHALDDVIPSGLTEGKDRGSWSSGVPADIQAYWEKTPAVDGESLKDSYEALIAQFYVDDEEGSYDLQADESWLLHPLRNGQTAQHRDPLSQFGTLGTGNHFFEVSVDQHDRVWAVVHSGSRGAGNRIGDYFTKRAADMMDQWFIKLPGDDRNLAYIPKGVPEYFGYLRFMEWAQEYALRSRATMMWRALNIAFPRVLKAYGNVVDSFDIHHNYLDHGTMVARKGAVNVYPSQRAIVPGAMGARSYIVRGLPGAQSSMFTCSHGAGRAMSRTAAEKLVSIEKHQADLAGLACDNSKDTLDETTSAYKDIDAVMHAQRDLVEPEFILTAKVCLKGKSLKRR